MGIFNLVDLGGGRKVTPAKYDEMLQKATDNIILSGFQNEEVLINNLMVNCFGNVKMAIKVITSLQSIYQKRIEEESEQMFGSTINCHNILEINNKLKIVGNVLDRLTDDIADNLKEQMARKEARQKALEKTEDLDDDDEDDEFFDDIDEDEEEETLEDPSEYVKNLVENAKVSTN